MVVNFFRIECNSDLDEHDIGKAIERFILEKKQSVSLKVDKLDYSKYTIKLNKDIKGAYGIVYHKGSILKGKYRNQKDGYILQEGFGTQTIIPKSAATLMLKKEILIEEGK